MSGIKHLITFFSSLLFSNLTIGQNWEMHDAFPGNPRDDASLFTIQDKVYCGLGRDNGFNCTRDFYIFDKNTETWSIGDAMPIGQERQYAVGFGWNGKGYIFGGAACDGTYLNDLWEFDPALNDWILINTLPSTGRAGMESFLIEDSLYIVGGKNQNGITNEVWKCDLTTFNWQQKNSVPNNGVWRGLSFEYGGLGYVGLGKNNLFNQTGYNSNFFKYHPSIDTWEVLNDPGLMKRTYIGTAKSGDYILCFGGVSENGIIMNTMERLDIPNWTLSVLPNFQEEPRKGGVCFLKNDAFYITTGVSTNQRFNETWRLQNSLLMDEVNTGLFSAYPNPAKNELMIELSSNQSGEIVIYSVDNKIVKSTMIQNVANVKMDVSAFPSGLYFLHFNNSILRFQVMK